MNRSSTINTFRSNDTAYSSDVQLSPTPSYHRSASMAIRAQGFRQPTRLLRISNPDQELIEGDSSTDDDNSIADSNKHVRQEYNPALQESYPTSPSSKQDSLKTVTIQEQPMMTRVTKKEKVPLKVDTGHLNKPIPNLPSETLSQFQPVMDTEKREKQDQDTLDRSTMVSPLHFNDSTNNLSLRSTDQRPKTSTHLATEFAHQNTSRYAKVSYHLTNDPSMIKMYRDAAEKTNDTSTQLLFAKYLLETASLFSDTRDSAAVGSLWGVSPTRKSTKPQPIQVIQQEDDESMLNGPPFSNNNLSTSSGGKTSTVNVYQQQAGLQMTSPKNASRHAENSLKSDMLEEEGIKWIKRLAKQDVPEACYILAKWMAQEKYGFKVIQRTKLTYLYQMAAKGGVPEAMYELAVLCEQEKQDPVMFLKYYMEASNQGYVNAIYRLSLGTLYGEIGLRQNTAESLRLMHRATQYVSEEFSEPCYTFGLILINEYSGADVPFDLRQYYQGNEGAILYFDRAAKLGNNKAQAKLGSIYEHGSLGETMNFAKAFDYYNSAALQGNSRAMLGLSRLNMKGSHGPRDTKEAERLQNDVSGWLAAAPYNEDAAFEWCKRAADKGYSEALAMLGWFYESGFGVPRDMMMADKYYALAAHSGNTGAKQRLFTNTSTTKQQHSYIQNPNISNFSTSVRKKTRSISKCYCM